MGLTQLPRKVAAFDEPSKFEHVSQAGGGGAGFQLSNHLRFTPPQKPESQVWKLMSQSTCCLEQEQHTFVARQFTGEDDHGLLGLRHIACRKKLCVHARVEDRNAVGVQAVVLGAPAD